MEKIILEIYDNNYNSKQDGIGRHVDSLCDLFCDDNDIRLIKMEI